MRKKHALVFSLVVLSLFFLFFFDIQVFTTSSLFYFFIYVLHLNTVSVHKLIMHILKR